MKKQENITGVKGNPLSLAIPLQKVTFTPNGKVTEDYYPAEGSVVEVMLENSSSRFTFNPVVEGNIVHFADKGTLPVGEYDVVIMVTEPDGTQRRSKWCNIVQVHDRTEAVLDAFDDFPDFGEVEVLDATVFIFAKGDKGDKGDPGEKGDKGDPGEKGDKGDAGTTDYNLLENKPTRVSQFENDALYATESFVNSSIATATATYRGSFNLVTDLGLSVGASAADVSAALATSISDADNNDYCFVQIPVATDTPTVIARIDRYKHNGSGWLYEYTLNNSGFTAEQWDAINSGITSGDVDKLDALPTNAQLTSLLNGKQDTINDLGSIRSGASAGATAYQKPQAGIPESDLSQGVKDKMNEKEVFWAEYGTTTAAEIDAAVAAGKEVLCRYNDRIYQLFINQTNLTFIQFFGIMDNSATYVRLKRSNNSWDITTNTFQPTSNKVNSWQATPDNNHYPSEKLVKESLDAKAGIGDVLFANFSNLTPKKTFEYDVSDTAYHPLFSRANTGISQLMSEVDDIVKFRITVTGTNIYARVDVVVRFQPALTYPCVMAWNENFNATASNTGISSIRTVFPKAINNGYDWIVEIAANNNSPRHVKVEVFEDTENVTWVETNEASSYNSSTQSYNALTIMSNRGLCANSNWIFPNGTIGNAGVAGYLSNYLNAWMGGGVLPLAGEAVAANFLCIISEQRMYRATNKNVPIDCDCGVFCVGGATGANSALAYNHIKQKTYWSTLTGDPALTMDTFARGDQVYLRCTLGQDGKIYPDGHLSNVKSAGYTWVHIGTAASATAINLDTCGKPFITLNNDGKVTHINGTAVMDSSMSKWGVVSQKITWNGSSYTLTQITNGWVSQELIDQAAVFGIVFNSVTGYFEYCGYSDLSAGEVRKVVARGVQTIGNALFRGYADRIVLPIAAINGTVTEIYYFANRLKEIPINLGYSLQQIGNNAFNGCTLLESIYLVVYGNSPGLSSTTCFNNCTSLKYINFYSLQKDLYLGTCPAILASSVAEWINGGSTTATYTITLHPTAYARAIADSDVQAALQAHTNVSLASAT